VKKPAKLPAAAAAAVPPWLTEVVRPAPAPVPWAAVIRAAFAVCGPLALGYALAIVTGVSLGIVMGGMPRVGETLEIYVNALNATPRVALIPFIILWFGLGPNAKIIASQNADWLREKAVPAADAMLRANDKVDVVFGHNDPMAEGAYLAAQAAGRDLKSILFVGIDGLPTPDGGIESVLQGRIGATFVYPTGGKQAVDWAKLILTKNVIPPLWVELPFYSINPKTAQDICNQFKCPDAKSTASATMAATAKP